MTEFFGHLMAVALEPGGLILGSRKGKRREREEHNEVEVKDIPAHPAGWHMLAGWLAGWLVGWLAVVLAAGTPIYV